MKSICCALALVLAACESVPPPDPHSVPLLGTPQEIEQFAGTWQGTLTFDKGGLPSTTLQMHIERGRETLDGTVLSGHQFAAHLLYVRLDGRKIAGAIEPAMQKECGCWVYTTFEGELADTGIIHAGVTRTESRDKVLHGSITFHRAEN